MVKGQKRTSANIKPLVFFNFKKKIFVLARKDKNKEDFYLYSNKKNSINEFSRVGKKVSIKTKEFNIDFLKTTNFHITEIEKELILSFTDDKKTFLAISKNGLLWTIKNSLPKINEGGCLVKAQPKHCAYIYGDKEIKLATSKDLDRWEHGDTVVLKPRAGFFDKNGLKIIHASNTDRGIHIIYDCLNRENGKTYLVTGSALLDTNNPQNVIWRIDSPLTEEILNGDFVGIKCLGSVLIDDFYHIYYKSGERLFVVSGREPFAPIKETTKKLVRSHQNPIIWPTGVNNWQSVGTFNPAAIHLAEKVHLIYRAVGEDGVSTLGYACLKDGINIDHKLDEPIYYPRLALGVENKKRFNYESGCSSAGCEDPRTVEIEGKIYMIYTHFNGYEAPRLALTAIDCEDFLNKNWNWRKPVFLSKYGKTQKNWVLFPEKINGQFALLSSLSPKVQIDYFDDLFEKDRAIESHFQNKPGIRRWDNMMRGAGTPPIRTEYGWLVLYHAMDARDPNKYKVGAMILDYKNPEKILYRSTNPILEPDMKYENEGFKAGVVYTCGAVVLNGTLFVYYGGADTVICVATAPLKEFLNSLTAKSQSDIKSREILFK
jgi:predicted GH43/DUF377 family glycosyl hydrolase